MRRAQRVLSASLALGGVFSVFTAFTPACHSNDAASASSDGPPAVDCSLVVWVHPHDPAAHVELLTSWEHWTRPGHEPGPARADGWRAVALFPPSPTDGSQSSEVAYGVVEDGEWTLPSGITTTTFHEGHEVALAFVPSCNSPALRLASAVGSASEIVAKATFLAAAHGARLDPTSLKLFARADHGGEGGAVAATITANPNDGSIELRIPATTGKKHAYFLHAKDTAGHDADPLPITAWTEARSFDWRDMVLYQVIVDRFRGDDGPLTPPSIASARAGGTVRGVRAAVEDGTFQALGANALWLSPLYRNPPGMWPGKDGHDYSSYHGYWPAAPRETEPLLGSDADLEALVASAHDRGIRILFDVVPNHTHESHPYVKAHLHDWFHDTGGTCVCGASCAWETHIQDCWFAPYLPDVKWEDDDAAKQMASDVAWWTDRWDGDGVRIDAIPMMPRAANRRIAHAVRAVDPSAFVLGENFVSGGGYDLLRYQLGGASEGGLDSEFHFPLMWALRGAIATEAGSFRDVQAAIEKGETAWAGSGAVMSLIIGNHDVTRFASESAGDAGGDGWNPAARSDDPIVYAKQRLAFAAIFALPGAPTILYGDEVALPGREDPDSRRVMPSDDALSDGQKATRDMVRKLGKLRACSAALRRGAVRILFASTEHLVLARELADPPAASGPDAEALVVLTRHDDGALRTPLPAVPQGKYLDALASGDPVNVQPDLTTLPTEAFSAHVYVPENSSCAPR